MIADIKHACEVNRITQYVINDDMSVDVDDDVNLYGRKLMKLPLTFGKVSGYFDCSGNILTTLKGCPRYVGGYFSCNNNNLTTLEGCPEYTGSGFYCFNNTLTSMNGLPMNFYVGGDFDCRYNNLFKRVNIVSTNCSGNIYSYNRWKF